MKKNKLFLYFILLLLVSACKETDTTAPVITLQGANPHVVTWGSASAYTDLGAVATDDFDGSLTVTTSGEVNVNMLSAGEYTLTYTVTDEAGNTAEATRKVIVDAAPFLSGNYSIENYKGVAADSTYNDTISALNTGNNIIHFIKFARINGANVYATLSGTNITVPSQTINCGIIPEDKTFWGSGTFSSDSVFTINYYVSYGLIEYSGHGIYTRN